MQQQGLHARKKRRFQTTTDSRHGLPVAPNVLDRQFTVTAPDTTWVTDITYLWTREGWLYLAVILDLFSRRVVGWSMSESITRQLTLDALEAALGQRTPPLACCITPIAGASTRAATTRRSWTRTASSAA